MTSQLAKVVRESKVIVCCGAGGVGKTTTSGALAVAAARAGRRVLVLTIDPSKRLAETLGVDRSPEKPVRLSPERLERIGVRGEGTLDAWMLDPKRVADEAVRRIVKDRYEAESLLGNRIYAHVTAMVAGMHEYTAMEALRRFVDEKLYDLVVLDTPPSRHALDFLDAPSRLARFLDGRIFRLFVPQKVGRLRHAAGSLVGRVLSGVLGEQFSGDLAAFFGTFANVLGVISRDVSGMREFLGGADVSFLLVTSTWPAALNEATFFRARTLELGLPFRGFVLNRSYAVEEGRVFPEASLLAGDTSEAALAALTKLQGLARREQAQGERDREVLARLEREAAPEGFAVALPNVATKGLGELEALSRLADVLIP